MNKDTIAAISTAPGEGAIAVVRISGTRAFEIASLVFSRSIQNFKTHTAHYGHILKADGTLIDSVLLLIMKGPHSYTGEDSVEISCHGGSLVTRRVLERVFEAGARAAQPGEFSLRAFLNGKLDLAQAEAIQELIAAKNELALTNAENQLRGVLSEKISSFQKELTDIAAILEAWVDFPEEGLEFASMEEIIASLNTICKSMGKLGASFHEGKALHDGYSLCLLGSPNVGKSSLMNALLGKERAIVTEIAGTTRDLLEEDLRLANLHFKLIDTAGVRKTDEIIEQEGIKRTLSATKEADLILLVLDASRPLTDEDRELLQSSPKEKTLIIWNKVDLVSAPRKLRLNLCLDSPEKVHAEREHDLSQANPGTNSAAPSESFESVQISAKKRIGLDELKAAIDKMIWKEGVPSKEEVLITKLRHHQALENATKACKAVIAGLTSGASAEFVASDLRAALNELGTIIGTNVTEDILSAIFSKFCLGK